MVKSITPAPAEINVGRKSRKGRMFGFPWAEARKKAFYTLAEELKADNASSLARTILEQFMFSVFGPAKSRELGLLSEWEARQIPPPSILEYAIGRYREHSHLTGRPKNQDVADEMAREDEINGAGKTGRKKKTGT